ncbi:MAG: cytochrome P450 [Actinomycetota bacterium]
MSVESMAMSAVAAIGRRPWLSNAVFRFTRWGNPFAEERFSYPYPMYERCRADGPVVFGRPYQQWFVWGYDEIREVFRSPDTTIAAVGDLLLDLPQYRKLSDSTRDSFGKWMLVNDPPEHTRLRSAVSRAFTPKQIAHYEPLVRNVTAELIAELPTAGEFDIVEKFTNELPIQIIAELLGLPTDHRGWLRDASREVAGMIEPLTPFDPDSMNRRFDELSDYFSTTIDERRQTPGNDVISAFVAADNETHLEIDEVIAMIGMLLTAGHETVTGMLGNALIALANHPDQRELLRTTPDLIDNAVEELLRFDGPTQVSGRQATADISIGGRTIKKGDNIGLMIGAANRDKRRWPDADELRLDRPDPHALSFGFGIHHCIGSSLARMEVRQALPLLLDALGDYTIDLERTEWKRSFALRSALKLPLTPGS